MQSVGSAAAPLGGDTGLPRSFMQQQHALQLKILAKTRPLGIIGVLPAFQGNMPPQIQKLHPKANITITAHGGAAHAPWPANSTRGECAWLASTDPLFGEVADKWMEILIADFGTDHWYQCDGFFTGAKPPWYEDEDDEGAKEEDDDEEGANLYNAGNAGNTAKEAVGVPADADAGGGGGGGGGVGHPEVEPDAQWTPVWKGAYNGMARTDPDAKWLYQGWAIRGWTDARGAGRIKALKDDVPYVSHWERCCRTPFLYFFVFSICLFRFSFFCSASIDRHLYNGNSDFFTLTRACTRVIIARTLHN